jgi:4-amino-4-deoxy-L-arabinose transferase-like glycosyltransferase
MRAFVRELLCRPWLGLLLALAIEAVVFFVGQVDFVPYDPLWYADIAHQLSTDAAEVFATHDTHPFVMRIGLTVPMAVLYRVFGVSPLVSTLPCLLATLGVVLVVYAAGPTTRAKWLGMLFCVTCVPLLRNTAVLNVDLPCAALMACSVLWLSWRERPRGGWWLVGAVVAWVMAFLVKETALWCGVVWIYAIGGDLRRDGLRTVARRFAPALAVGAGLAVGYLVLCAQLWGDPWARFRGIEALTYKHAWTLHGQGASAWVRRLTWNPPKMLVTMFQVPLVLAVLAPLWLRGAERLWWVSAMAFILFYWFGSTSLRSYSPLPLSQRMVLPALPGILVLAALASDRALERLPRSRWWKLGIAAIAIAVIAPAAFAIAMAVAGTAPETASFAALRKEVADPSRRFVLVCGEASCVSAIGIHFGLVVPANLTVMFAADFARAPLPEHVTVRALVNLPRGRGVRQRDPHDDMTLPIAALALPPIAGDRDVRLYDAGDGARLRDTLRAAL